MKEAIHVSGCFMGPGVNMQADILGSKYLSLFLIRAAFVQLTWLIYAPLNPFLGILITTKKQTKNIMLFFYFLTARKGAVFLFSSYTDIGTRLLTS